jgi:hypothetical protein
MAFSFKLTDASVPSPATKAPLAKQSQQNLSPSAAVTSNSQELNLADNNKATDSGKEPKNMSGEVVKIPKFYTTNCGLGKCHYCRESNIKRSSRTQCDTCGWYLCAVHQIRKVGCANCCSEPDPLFNVDEGVNFGGSPHTS